MSNLNKPSLMIFSQSFDPLWSLNGVAPVKVFSFLNGFPIEKNGTYILEYRPQRFVEIGFLISLASLIILVIIIKPLYTTSSLFIYLMILKNY